jgi:hypothetical protein
MAAPTYATDLTTMVDFDGTPASPTVAEASAPWADGRSPVADDTDFPIQSSTHASLTMNTTGKAGILATNVAAFTWTSGHYLFGWIIWLAPGAIAEQVSGGLVMLAGSAVGAYKVFYVGGKSWGLYPYGGWQNFAVDPEMTEDETVGTPAGYAFVGAGGNVLTAVSKGNPLGFDVFRYGRGEFRVAVGDGTTPATFGGMAAANDASAARWGLFQAIAGSYKMKGLMILGYAAAVTFVDSNKNIVIDDMIYVQSTFNRIEIRNASSSVTWTGINVSSLNAVSPGTLEVVDNATVLFTSCSFTDMDTLKFLSNSSILSTTFRGCGQITPNGADMSGSIVTGFEGTTDTSALIWNVATDPNGLLDGMKFTKGTAATHAIEFGLTSPLTMTLTGIDFTGFSGTTTAATLNFLRTTGTTTVNLVGCTGTITAQVTGTHTVNFVVNPVAISVHVQDADTGADIVGARVLVLAAATGPLPYQDSVSITASTTTATVTHTAHGLATNQYVKISGVTQFYYNGVFQITWISADSYSYTMAGSPTSPATGTPVATAAIISGVTDALGDISDQRSYSADQDFTGTVRKSSAPPYYRSASTSGTIDSVTGLFVTVGLISDE